MKASFMFDDHEEVGVVPDTVPQEFKFKADDGLTYSAIYHGTVDSREPSIAVYLIPWQKGVA